MADVTALAATANTGVPLVADVSVNYAAGGMTALMLLRKLREKCGVSGTAPITTANLPVEMSRLFGYINEAWMEIQGLHKEWEFMRQPVSFTTLDGKNKYSSIEQQIASFGKYKLDSFIIGPVSDPGSIQDLLFLPYEEFRRLYLFGPATTRVGLPFVYSQTPQRDMVIWPIPDAAYKVDGECYARPTELVSDSDRPSMPGEFHMAIVYLAMQYYGMYESAPEVHDEGLAQYNKLIARLAHDQLPIIQFGPPLA